MFNIERVVQRLSLWLDWVARGTMMGILLLSIANIVSSVVWTPIFGTYEFVSFLTVLTLSFALAYCTLGGGHVHVDFLVRRLSPRTGAILDIITGILSVGLFVILAWQSALYATSMWQKGEVSSTLYWPFYIFVYCISFGCFVTCLVLLVDVGKAVGKAAKK